MKFTKVLSVVALLLASILTSSPASAGVRACKEGLVLKFGQACTYRSVNFGVAAPKLYRHNEFCSGKYGYTFVVTTRNNSSRIAKFDSVTVQASSRAGDGDKCYDSANQISGEPDSSLLPHRLISFKEGFAFNSYKDLTVQVNVDPFYTFNGPTVYWTR